MDLLFRLFVICDSSDHSTSNVVRVWTILTIRSMVEFRIFAFLYIYIYIYIYEERILIRYVYKYKCCLKASSIQESCINLLL